MTKDEISPRLNKMLEKGRLEARKRVVERGLLQFRADPRTMELLIEISEQRGIPLGTMLREWVRERLSLETQKTEDAQTIKALCLEIKSKLDVLQTSFVQYTTTGRTLSNPAISPPPPPRPKRGR